MFNGVHEFKLLNLETIYELYFSIDGLKVCLFVCLFIFFFQGVLFTSDCQEQSMPLGSVKMIALDAPRDKKELSPLCEGPTIERPKLRVYVRRRKPKPTTTQIHQSTEPVVDSSKFLSYFYKIAIFP